MTEQLSYGLATTVDIEFDDAVGRVRTLAIGSGGALSPLAAVGLVLELCTIRRQLFTRTDYGDGGQPTMHGPTYTASPTNPWTKCANNVLSAGTSALSFLTALKANVSRLASSPEITSRVLANGKSKINQNTPYAFCTIHRSSICQEPGKQDFNATITIRGIWSARKTNQCSTHNKGVERQRGH